MIRQIPKLVTTKYNINHNIIPKYRNLKRNQSEHHFNMINLTKNEHKSHGYDLFHDISNYIVTNDKVKSKYKLKRASTLSNDQKSESSPHFNKQRASTPKHKPEINQVSKMVVESKFQNMSFQERSLVYKNDSFKLRNLLTLKC